MKKLIYLSIFLSFALWQCTPKTTEKAKSGMQDASDKVEAVVEKTKTFRSNPPAVGPAPKVQMGTYEQFELDNGLKVIVVENHKIPRVSYQLFIDAPSISEGEAAGAASMAGDLMRTGTTTKSKVEIDEAIDFVGASLNTSPSGMFGSSLKKHSPVLLGVMSDVLMNPTFSEEEFEKLKKQTLSGLASSKDDPNAIAGNVSQVVRYGKNHPYGEIVTEESVNNIELSNCKDYYNTYFQPNISYLVVVGDIVPSEAKTIAEKYFGAWKKTKETSQGRLQQCKAPEQTQVDFVNKTGAVQSVINITYPIDFKPGSDDAIKARVMNTMLGGFFRSYLNANLREDKAYTYGSRSQLSSDKNIGYFNANASVRNEVTDSSIVQFLHELNRIRDTRISDDDLTLVKNVMAGNFARGLERPQTIARFALNTARYNLPSDYYATYLERLAAVSADDIMTMAKKYIRPENAHILVVGNKDEVADKLVQFAPSGKINFYDTDGNPVKMDDVAVPTDMTAEKVIEDYLNAIGGAAKLKAVKDMTQIMGMEMQGMQMTITNIQKAPNMMSSEMAVAGMGVMQKQVFDGTKGSTAQMGQSKAMSAEEMEAAKKQAIMFDELNYSSDYTMELKGIEAIEGANAYKVVLTDADGSKKTEFYDMKTSLKIRSVETSEVGGVTTSQIVDLSDYKEVDGIKVPHKVVLTGAAPMPLNMEMKELKINSGVGNAAFKVD